MATQFKATGGVVTPNITLSGSSSNQVHYLNSSNVLVGSPNLTFNGTILTSSGFAGPINGTVGAITPAAGSFTSITVSADSAFTSVGALQIPSGATTDRPTGAPGKIRWSTTLGIYEGYTGTGWISLSGSVTSVALSLPAELTVSGSPITSSGTLSASWSSQTQAYVFAAPAGGNGTPAFRALAATDIPTLNQNTTGTAANVTGIVALVNGGTGANTVSQAQSNLQVDPSGTAVAMAIALG